MSTAVLSQWQFAITSIYHFLFVPITLGLTFFLALLETCYVRTKNEEWKKQCRILLQFFSTVFLINFAMGVVTGIVQEFHFGMNWSEYSRFMGDIFGAPLALEALTAFFLESTFLGIWIFGWDKLSPKVHCIVMWLVALGSNLSAFWILVANSFMQSPLGFSIENGRAVMTDFGALVTNHYVVGEMSHTFFAGMTTGGVLIVAISAYKILQKGEHVDAFVKIIKGAALYTLIGSVLLIASGHFHTQYLAKAQPMKLASMEALWHTEDPAPFAVLALPNEEKMENDFEITIPFLFSFLVHDSFSGEVKGISDLQQEAVQMYGPGKYIPPVMTLFYAFRVMVGAGGLMLLLMFAVYMAARKGVIQKYPLFLKVLLFSLPLPFLANSAGWIVAEVGRQPWLVVGLQQTVDGVSPNLTAMDIWITMIGFTLIYLVLIVLALGVAIRFIKSNPVSHERSEA
ncbi:cytochrome ubiquinol oxidase subunit I [Selenomonas sp. TAMA-11512]|uniref:cytochrome ubiquinol oxidase subunit I n=1 Tax=Selenomonas sp. TAMA-11512 TaxID=3095337 RepID=UPI003092149B|nr:cytochrome ubiquinol oxidase subunit I [Selenomonas sp. TAMA-11512]